MTKTYRQDPLWLKLEAMELDDPQAKVPLSARLAAETILDLSIIQTAIAEYKKYLYLAVTYQIPLVMPTVAERVWITHITYTRHYWDYMCNEVLGFDLHYRSPAELAEVDGRTDYRGQIYAAYAKTFGSESPAIIDAPIPESRSGQWVAGVRFLSFFFLFWALLFVTNGAVIAVAFATVGIGFGAFLLIGSWSCEKYRKPGRPGLSAENEGVWRALLYMPLATLGSAVEPFSVILKKNTGWTEYKCELAIDEYRRFLLVRYAVQHPVTPSPDVDKVWHVHLIHSEHYWNDLCGRILARPVHHNPATGEPGEWARFRDQYLRTLAAYETLFGTKQPMSIWPRKPSIPQGRALWSAIAAAGAVACIHLLWPVAPLWLSAFAAIACAAVAALAGYHWPVNDARITRKDFGKRKSGQWEVSVGSCGGCGGCGG